MIEKFLNLFERAVVALEVIARGVGDADAAGHTCDGSCKAKGRTLEESVNPDYKPDEDPAPEVDDSLVLKKEKEEAEDAEDGNWLYDEDKVQARYAMESKKQAIDDELERLGYKVPKSWPYGKRHQALCDISNGKGGFMEKYLTDDAKQDIGEEPAIEPEVVEPEEDFDLFDTEEPEVTVTIDDVKAAAQAFVKRNGDEGKQKAYTLLQEVGGCQKLKDLDESKYAAFVEACNA